MSSRLVRPRLREALLRGDEPAWLRRHIRRDYIRRVVLSAPPWVAERHFAALRAEAELRTRTTGVRHVLDHIIPVTHPLVSGLTVPWNMRVLDHAANARKSNKLHLAFQGEMFDQPEQLRML